MGGAGANMNMGGQQPQEQGQEQTVNAEEIRRAEEEALRKKKEEQEAKEREMKKKEEEQKKVTERDLGNQAYKKKDFKNALIHYEKAFEQDNKDVLALNNMAAVYIEMGELDKAME